MENKTVLQRNSLVTPNILARKPEEDPLPYCKTEAESEGSNGVGPLASVTTCHCTFKHSQTRVQRVTKVCETLSKSPLHKSTIQMSISNNKTEVINITHNGVNKGLLRVKLLHLNIMFDL
jgi:hypothetical protein